MDNLTEQWPWVVLIGGLLMYETFQQSLNDRFEEASRPNLDEPVVQKSVRRRRKRERLRFYHPSADTEFELLIIDQPGMRNTPTILEPAGWTIPLLTRPAASSKLGVGKYSLNRALTPDEIDRLVNRLVSITSGRVEISVLDSQLPRLIRQRCRKRAAQLRFVYDTVLID